MKILSSKFINFRNYASLELGTDHMVNVFYGDNAQGKTNFLEGLYYAAFGFPSRTKNEEELITFGQDFLVTEVAFNNRFGANRINIKKYPEKGRSKKLITYNDNSLTAKEHYGLLNMVLFAPDDLQMVKGEPGLRRKFLDMEIAQVNRYYYQLLVKYNKLLAQRNKFLKLHKEEGILPEAEIQSWDEEVAKVAGAIYDLRRENLKHINSIAGEIYGKLTGQKEEFLLSYVTKTADELNSEQVNLISEDSSDFYLRELKKRRGLDLVRGYTSVGPHRDDLLLQVNKKNLRSFGSQGQQRSAALVLKLAEIEIIYKNKEEYPILLLDDVMSELDEKRRKQLLGFIDGRVQTFITLNDKSLVENLGDCHYYQVENGRIRED